MGGWDQILLPASVLYLILTIPPTVMEVFCYYTRGGLVQFETMRDETHQTFHEAARESMIYRKRFCDRPESEAAKAFYAYLDWSSGTQDKSIVFHRRQFAKSVGDQRWWALTLGGPFVFNYPKKQWLRGDDAAALQAPQWGAGGEARARQEFQEATDKGFNRYWHYKILRRIRREKEAGITADDRPIATYTTF